MAGTLGTVADTHGNATARTIWVPRHTQKLLARMAQWHVCMEMPFVTTRTLGAFVMSLNQTQRPSFYPDQTDWTTDMLAQLELMKQSNLPF